VSSTTNLYRGKKAAEEFASEVKKRRLHHGCRAGGKRPLPDPWKRKGEEDGSREGSGIEKSVMWKGDDVCALRVRPSQVGEEKERKRKIKLSRSNSLTSLGRKRHDL